MGSGSSPRVWGRFRRKVDGRYHVIRFIPTRVGQMCYSYPIYYSQTSVHPHACGADWHYFGRGKWWLSGSSPRVWGRSMYRMRPPSCCRGSSPRVWGRCCVEEPPTEHAFRFIPTRVGQMTVRAVQMQGNGGSSPRVWGRCPRIMETKYPKYWFIPTRVGQIPYQIRHGRGSTPVHPHACGADVMAAVIHGIHEPVHPHACGADTGSTGGRGEDRAVHPHACGADGSWGRRKAGPAAVHPHACGADDIIFQTQTAELRFIPTRVGQIFSCKNS